ncbi:hypothetical protein MNBD_GAMMA04-1108 [hydrothermal vent metagenome]|uniref:AB hydrolase-1 domain-containing protein n=1 Tax=hydrothermal vent metagenome TaxID=652676 RepID=A0A3B0VPQ5_9ZZZZ
MRILKFILLVSLIYFSVAAYLFFTQRSLIYFPPPPSDHGYLEETFQFKKARVQVIVLNQGHEKSILYFGGNAEAVENNALAFIQHFPNHTVYLVQYRGYGNSTGKPAETNLYADSLAIFERLKQQHKRITVIGRSLGSGIASHLAAKKKVDQLILVTPYDSLQSLAQTVFPFFPMSILLLDKYNALAHAQKIKTPTLLLIAEKDQIIPLTHSENLAQAFSPSIATVVIIPKYGHNNISYSPLYYQSIRQFILNQ